MNVLEVRGLGKRYGEKTVINGISFDVRPGEIVGLLGPNGAGKTTVINMILGVLEPTAGNVCIEHMDLVRSRSKVLERTNFAASYALLPGNMTVFENLFFFGWLYGVHGLTDRIDALLRKFDLARFRDTKCGVLSSGEQMLMCLVKAMLNAPRLLLLDEPTASLDPSVALDIRERICEFVADSRAAVLWASHNMQEIQDVCDRVLFMTQGRIILEGDPKLLPAQYGKVSLEELFIAVARDPLLLRKGK